MSKTEKIKNLLKDAAKLDKGIKKVISETNDYDLSRLLKKVDAELMDLQHNLDLACQLAEKKRKDK
jgi:hypothetical protein